MALFHPDKDKCDRNGRCVRVCPVRIIDRDPEGYPVPARDAEKLCISCGHCVAVCPSSALVHARVPLRECQPAPSDQVPGPEQAEAMLRSRRSVRAYKRDEVKKHLLHRLIDTARFAPSGHNSQPVHWTVVQSRDQTLKTSAMVVDWMRHAMREQSELAREIPLDWVVRTWEAGEDPVARGAPHVVLARGEEGERTAGAACTIALAHLELLAPSFGLGACWAGFYNLAARYWPDMRQELDIPEGHECFGALLIGYPAFGYQLVPPRRQARIQWV